MSGKPSAAVERALARVAAGQTAYSAAKAEGLALSTIYRALKRLRIHGAGGNDQSVACQWWEQAANG